MAKAKEFRIDTRIPVIMVQWKGIGNATLLYEDEEWWLKIRGIVLFQKMESSANDF